MTSNDIVRIIMRLVKEKTCIVTVNFVTDEMNKDRYQIFEMTAEPWPKIETLLTYAANPEGQEIINRVTQAAANNNNNSIN